MRSDNKYFYLIILLISLTSQLCGQSQETIKKCSQDMTSSKAEIRQQAAMILGKYDEPEVTELLLNHLKDESNLVRRAVLVSLQDRIQKRMVSLTRMVEIFDLLEDKDVEVRRLASSSVQFFVGIYLRENGNPNSQRVPALISPDQKKEIKNKFLNSIQDTDDIVRLNNLTTISQNIYLVYDPDFLKAIFSRIDDTNKSAIIMALDLLMLQHNLDVKGIADKLVEHPEPDVAIALIKFLDRKKYLDDEIWHKLAKRTNLEVSSKAINSGFILGIKDMDTKYGEFIQENTNPINQRLELMQHLRLHPKKNELIKVLLEDKSNTIKLDAIKILPQFFSQPDLMNELKKFINDTSTAIKEEATNLLFQFADKKDLEILKLLFTSDKVEIRLAVLNKMETLKITVDEILLESMLDDSKSIRLKAIEICGKGKSNNAQLKSMLIQSMEDLDPEIRISALKALNNYVTPTELMNLYKKFIDNDDKQIKSYIASQMLGSSQPEAQTILKSLAEDKDINVNTQANLSLYLKGDKTRLEILAKNLISKDLALKDKINLQQALSKEKGIVSKSFGLLLADESEEIRLGSIKYFNFHRELYLEEYFEAAFSETNQSILQIACEIYLANKFNKLETVKKMYTSTNQRIKILGLQILTLNYDATYLPTLKELLKSSDPRINYSVLEIIKKQKINEMDTLIIEKLKNKADKTILPYLLLALIVLNTDTAKNYINTITENDSLYKELETAKQIKGLDDTRPTKSGGKTR